MKLLLDTCALIWWTLDQKKLPPATLETLNDSELLISSISIWEVGIKVKNKKLDIGMSPKIYTEKLKEISMLEIIAVNETIWLKNIDLTWEHRDPADRTIVATAELMDCPIVTTDATILSFYPMVFWKQ